MSGAGIVAALAAELRPLASQADGTLLTVSGIGWSAASESASRLVGAGARALISWGVAGGLDPALAAGTLVLPREVLVADGARFEVDGDWHRRLTAALPATQPMSAGALLTAREPIGSRVEKAAAFRTTTAVAVDMESGAIAAIAVSHRLPFLAVRAIVDTAGDSLPGSLLAAATASGAPRLGRWFVSLLRSPTDIALLIRLAARFRAACRSLAVVARSGALASFPGASDPIGR